MANSSCARHLRRQAGDNFGGRTASSNQLRRHAAAHAGLYSCMLVATVLSGATQSVAAFGSPLSMVRADIMPFSLARGLARQKRAMMSSSWRGLLGLGMKGIRSAHVHTRSKAQDAKEPGSPPLVAVVTGAGKGLGYHVAHQLLHAGFFVVFGLHDRESCQALHARLALEGYKRQSLVLHLDVKRVKSISAAAVKIHESCPDGITVVVNNAAMHPDGFDYETAQEVLDVNFFGAQNVVRRMVPARWPEAITGRWLPAKSGFKGMRRGGVIVNIVCQTSLEPCDERAEAAMQSGIQALYLDVRNKFESCSTETAIVMKVTEYLGHVAAGTHIDAGWPSNPYLVSKVCLGVCIFDSAGYSLCLNSTCSDLMTLHDAQMISKPACAHAHSSLRHRALVFFVRLLDNVLPSSLDSPNTGRLTRLLQNFLILLPASLLPVDSLFLRILLIFSLKVALARLTRIVDASLDALATKRYEEDISCVAVDPGWMATQIGGPDAPVRVEVSAYSGVSVVFCLCFLRICHGVPFSGKLFFHACNA